MEGENHIKKLYEKGRIKNIRHLYLHFVVHDIETEGELIQTLKKLCREDLARKVVDFDQNEMYFEPTSQSRNMTSMLIHKDYRYKLNIFKCLWNYTYQHEKSYRQRLYEIGLDFNNNYGVNIFQFLKDYQHKINGFEMDEEVLENLSEILKNEV